MLPFSQQPEAFASHLCALLVLLLTFAWDALATTLLFIQDSRDAQTVGVDDR